METIGSLPGPLRVLVDWVILVIATIMQYLGMGEEAEEA